MSRNKVDYLNYFRPNLFLPSILDINIDSLVSHKIRMVIFDLDNTLAPHFVKHANHYSRNLINQIKARGMLVVIASNNTKQRVLNFCKTLDNLDDVIWLAGKPFPFKIKRVLKKFNVSNEQAIIIGDQFITDIWAANILKTRSILITSLFNVKISRPTSKLRSLHYFIEHMIYQKLARKNLINTNDLSNIVLGTNDDVL